MNIKLIDNVSVDENSAKRTTDGYLTAECSVSRANNIQLYTGDEMGKPGVSSVRVYRPESEVFSRDSMGSIAHKPMTNDHPNESVSADTWKRDAVGHMGDEVTRQGDFVRVPLIMMDGAAIRDFEAGKRELSLGYTADIDWTDGVTESGEKYDAIQRNIQINHLALVDKGRANQELRIVDDATDGGKDRAWGVAPINHDQNPKGLIMDMLTVVLGDKAVQVSAPDAPAIEAFKGKMADAEAKAITDMAEKDKGAAKLQAEIDDLKGKVMDEAALDKRVQDRAELIGKAKLIAKDLDTTGVSDAGIRKATVAAKLGDAAIKDKSEAYIDARFDILTEDSEATTDSLRHLGVVKSTDGAGGWNDSAFKSAGVKMKKEA